jgi:hypothetical protein
MRTPLLPAMALVGALVASGCYPSRIESIEDFDTATTLHAPGVDFSTVGTYAIVDTVYEIGDSSGPSVDHAFDASIIANLKTNLNALGWTEVDEASTQPDMMVSAVVTTSTNVGWTGGWYDYFYGWWGGWGWYYPPVYYPYSYQTGTLLVGMLDVRGTSGGTTDVPMVWVAAVNGVLRSTSSATVARVNELIDQAFAQSPYLLGE